MNIDITKALQIAASTVTQWDCYDRFRETDADRLLYAGELEPSGVTMARGLIALATAVKETLADNLHLADGNDCTLRKLVVMFPEQTEE